MFSNLNIIMEIKNVFTLFFFEFLGLHGSTVLSSTRLIMYIYIPSSISISLILVQIFIRKHRTCDQCVQTIKVLNTDRRWREGHVDY